MTVLRRWFLSLRPYSFTASLVPVLLVATPPGHSDGDIVWWTFPLYALAAVLFHSGTNVLNDYYDFRHGVDRPEDRDPTHTIIRGIVTPRFMLISGHIYFFAGIAAGAVAATVRGPLYFAAGLAGATAAYFYTGSRFSLKYRGFGDMAVFILMGPALVAMGDWTVSGTVGLLPVLISLPPSFLVTAILHGNNLRDLETDRSAGIHTVAGALGYTRGAGMYVLLLTLAYLAAMILVAAGAVPPHGLIVLLSTPLARQTILSVQRGGSATSEGLVTLPMRTAALHLLFSVLYLAGLLLGQI
jgi:1,4-dihydroxy-2-naphthoate polyprenyltransferase